jgi:signal transduction histidine kinase
VRMTRSRSAAPRARPEVVVGWLGAGICVVLLYVVVVRGGGILIGRTESPHLGLSVLATAAVAVLIDPVRSRVERLASRLMHGRVSPYDVLSEFSRQVADRPDEEPIADRMARLLAAGTAAAWAQVWLVVNDRLVLVAAHPEAATKYDDLPSFGTRRDPGRRSVVVGHGGVVLGVLRVQERDGRPLTPIEVRLLAGLAAQAGLVLRSAQLRAELTERHAELARQAGELRDARDELVNAQYRERRRLERDLHDGAQQELVALAVNLRLVQALAGRTPDGVAPLLAEQAKAAGAAIETLSTLARGALPPVLRDQGLSAALSVVAGTSPPRVDLAVDGVGRFTRTIESAVYFCCLEALQNAAKHSGASTVFVRLTVDMGHLRLTVRDDGSGMTGAPSAGAGLSNMRDRVDAVAGSLTCQSRPGAGTSVTAVVPALRVPSQRSR